ncbi:type II secretion system protein [Fervidibacillus albus]|uniref:type II secretion system protein n=1 Tax=Fervidibacillus albus TaxID=2980026 RepID=UPI0023B27B06|nr:type II secretion system protein [Fervidibacillus albus]
MNTLKKRMKNEKGMTLVELLAVLVILGIIAAIAVPMVGNIINDSKDKAILADAQMILSGAKLAYANGEGQENGDEITFDHTILNNYVDGVTLEDGDQVTYSGNEWTVTYSKLADINNDKFDINDNSITNTKLSQYLKGEEDSSTSSDGDQSE